MTEHQRETAFLRHLIVFDNTEQGRKLEKSIVQVQLDERCVKRGAWLMALLALLSAVGLAYGEVLVEDLPFGRARFVLKLICVFGLASLISLAAFVGILMAYRKKSNGLREECRRLITKLLELQLGKPCLTPLPGAGVETFESSRFEPILTKFGAGKKLDETQPSSP